MGRIAIIDYGMGNVRSVQKGLERLGFFATITRSTKVLEDCSHLILPGVGAFPDCMRNLKHYGLIDPIFRELEKGKPFLGICLGYQLLFKESEEFGFHPGLGVLEGRVLRFQNELERSGKGIETKERLKIPHMGWNKILVRKPSPLFKGLPEELYLYFVHSYYVVPDHSDIISSYTTYGIQFASSIWKDHIFACQFHPEKSQDYGLEILKNFGSLS
ncbi:MAG TPA: imidazole glycerol phosphate synthase subunit HisH [Nitrospiria bacterium]|jgi:glutamine amidotransferase